MTCDIFILHWFLRCLDVRTKCTNEQVWLRYKAVLEDNQMHDLCKSVLQMQSELMLIGNSLLNNLQHLRSDQDAKVSAMY